MAHDHDRMTYPPLDTLKPVAEGLWIVDSALARAGVRIPVRMTVLRLASGGLWLHSPTPCLTGLRAELEREGPVAHIVAPSFAHWTFAKDWQAACPAAAVWAAPGLRERGQVKRSGLRIDHDLAAWPPEEWAGEIDQVLVPGGMNVAEVAFHHRPTRTLVLTDLVENFEPEKLNPVIRPLIRAAGAMAPDGKAAAHYRLVMNMRRETVKEAARKMLSWAPERVIFSHGAWFESDGAAQLRRSFRWLL
jgi:hypothetical protein